jgi:hypothetical protein
MTIHTIVIMITHTMVTHTMITHTLGTHTMGTQTVGAHLGAQLGVHSAGTHTTPITITDHRMHQLVVLLQL